MCRIKPVKKIFCIFFILFFVPFFFYAQDESDEEMADVTADVTADVAADAETSGDSEERTSSDSDNKVKIPKYEYILDESNSLHIHSYEDENVEYLTVNKSKFVEGRTVVIFSKQNLKRFYYDKDFYLEHVEIWKTAEKAADYKIKKKIYYEYEDKGLAYKTFEIDYENELYTEYVYSEKKLLLEKTEYDIKDLNIKPEDRTIDRNKMQKKMIYYYLYKYDEKERILMESETHLEYYKNSVREKKRNTRKNIYEYIRVDCPPSKTFFENDVLRLKIVYTSKKDYVQNVYFDNDTYVRTEFVNARKHLEVFYVSGEEKLRRTYD